MNTEKKKICFFSGDITRDGGTERVATMLANGLHRSGNWQIVFLSLVEEQKQLFFSLDPNIPHYTLGTRWLRPGPGYLRLLPKLRRFLKKQQIDMIVDIDIVLDILSLPAAKYLKTKVISWEHFNYCYENRFLYRKLILNYSVRHSDYIVTLTQTDKNVYTLYGKRKKNICVIHNPMPDLPKPHFCSQNDSLSQNNSFLQMDTVSQTDVFSRRNQWIVTIGGLIPRKGMDLLIKVAVLVLKKHPDWKWFIIGEGTERAFLEQAIDKYHLHRQLILTGQIHHVNDYLQRASIYVMTSREEGLPMCLLEAKAWKLPTVSFDIATGPGEVILDGVNGFLISPFHCREMVKKLLLLMENPELLQTFSAHAWDNATTFLPQKFLHRWNQLFLSLLGKR